MPEPEVVLGVAVVIGVAVAPQLPSWCWLWLLALVPSLLLCLALPRWGAALCGLALGLLAVHTLPVGPELRGEVAVQGVVVGAPLGRTADVSLHRVARPGAAWRPVSGRIRLAFPETAASVGSEVLAWGDARPVVGAVLPDAPSGLRGAPRARVRTVLKVREHALVGPPAIRVVPGRHSGVLRALALGDRGGLDPDTVALLRRTGTAHVLAISGFHVGLVAGAVWWGWRLISALGAVLWERGVPRWPGWLSAACAASGYAWAVGAPVSAQRAALLVVVAAVVRVMGGRAQLMSVLGLVVGLVLVLDPGALDTPGFQLSFGAVIGLLRLVPLLERWRPGWWPRWLRGVWTSLAVSSAATLGTLPVAGWWFQTLPPLSPIANLVAIPAVAFVLGPLAAVACWGPSPIAEWSAWLADPAVDLFIVLLGPLAVEPLTPAWGPTLAVLGVGLMLLPHRVAGPVLVMLGSLSWHEPAEPSLRLTFLDVGQGDATLVELPDGRLWLVDGGPPGNRVLHWLRRRGIRHLDAVVATHDQDDHTGGLVPVLRSLRVDALWVAGRSQVPELEAIARERGVAIVVPDEAIGGVARLQMKNANDRSVVLAPSIGDVHALLLGDLQERGERVILPDLPVWIPLLKAGHHGSRTSSGAQLVASVYPQLVVVSAGRWNVYGHPHPDVVNRWRDTGASVLRTDVHGTIEVVLTPQTMKARAWTVQHGWRDHGRWSTQHWTWGEQTYARPVDP